MMNADTFLPAIAALDDEIARLMTARQTLVGLLPTSAPAGPRLPAPRLVADSYEPQTSTVIAPRRVRVLAALPEDGGARVKDVAAHLNAAQAHVHADIEAMTEKGHAERVARGTYVRTPAGTVALETVWSGSMRTSLIDREHATQALSGRAVQL